MDGEHDNLFWYNTGMAPVLSYMLLTGDRKPIENGVMADLLRGQEILASGREPDWALNSASIGFLNKAAYLTGDGRYREYLRRTGMDLRHLPARAVLLAGGRYQAPRCPRIL